MTENKYQVGSIWKRRDGAKAIIIQEPKGDFRGLRVCTEGGEVYLTDQNGRYRASRSSEAHKCDLIEPWKEPRKGTVWLEIYNGGRVIIIAPEKGVCLAAKGLVAVKRVDWAEGDGQ